MDLSAADLNQLIDTALQHLEDENSHGDANHPALPNPGREALAELQLNRADTATLTAAIDLCRNTNSRCRQLGAAILGQLGHSRGNSPYGVFREERYRALHDTLRTEIATTANPGVLNEVCIALSHLKDHRAIGIVLELIDHPNADVRTGVVMALTCHQDEAAVSGLIRLSSDRDTDVRDLATFALALQIDVDTAPIRSALHARLDDIEPDVRNEAIEGLARRHDRTVLPYLVRELQEQVSDPLFSAAREFADPSLCPALMNAGRIVFGLKEDGHRLANYLEGCWRKAVAACGCRFDNP